MLLDLFTLEFDLSVAARQTSLDSPSQVRRASSDAYLLITTFVPADEPQASAVGNLLPQTAPALKRAQVDAFSITASFNVQSEPQAACMVVAPERAQLARSASSAYVILQSFVIQSEPQAASLVVTPERARRAANWAYDIVQSFVVQAEPQATSVVLTPDRAILGRTAAVAYSVTQSFVAQAEPQATALVELPDFVLPAKRAAASAYSITVSFVAEPEQQAISLAVVPDRARRALVWAYEINQTFVVQDEPSISSVVMPFKADQPSRAATEAYSLYGLSAQILQPLPPELPSVELRIGPNLPDTAKPVSRPAVTVVWIATSFVVDDVIPPAPPEPAPPPAPAPAQVGGAQVLGSILGLQQIIGRSWETYTKEEQREWLRRYYAGNPLEPDHFRVTTIAVMRLSGSMQARFFDRLKQIIAEDNELLLGDL